MQIKALKIALLSMFILGLSACGKKGPLRPPSDKPYTEQPDKYWKSQEKEIEQTATENLWQPEE